MSRPQNLGALILVLSLTMGILMSVNSVATAATGQNRDAISYGQTITGSLSVAGELDTYTFSASAGDVIVVRMAELTSALEPQLLLYNPGGTQIENSWSYTMVELNEVTLATTGTYSVVARDNNNDDTGDYSIHLQCLNAPAGATGITYDQTLSSSFSQAAETDAFTFSATVGDKILSRLSDNNGAFTPLLRLIDPDGVQVSSNTSSEVAEIHQFELTQTGTYALLVMDNNGTQYGDYNLHLQRLNPPVGATPISYGQTLTDELIWKAETVAFTFTAASGDIILARATEASNPTELKLRLYDPDGVYVVGNWSYTMVEHNQIELTSSGTYTLLVMDQPGTDIGGFTLHLQRLNGPAGATGITYDQTLSSSFSQAAETDAFTFSATVGDKILSRLSDNNGAFTPLLRLIDPDGVQVSSNTSSEVAEIHQFELTQTGTYALLVMDNNGTQYGDYNLHLQRLNPPVGATPISYGQTLTDELIWKAETVAFTFTAASGDIILARATEASNPTELKLRIYDPDGVMVVGNWSYTMVEHNQIELTSSGTYTLLVMDQPGTDIGGFTLHLQRLNGPAGATGITYDQTLSSSFSQAAETDAFTFSATVGDKILSRLSDNNGAFTPLLRLIDPDGVQVSSNTSSEVAEIHQFELTQTGTYALLVMDNNGTQYGDYNLHLQRLNPPVGATPISYGQTLTDELIWAGETVAFTFAATSGDIITATMTELTSTMEPKLRLYDPDGVMLAANWSYTTVELTDIPLAEAGDYTLLAMDHPGIDIGEFTVHIIGTGVPVPDNPLDIETFALYANHPNPFNPSTTIRYDLPTAQPVKLMIYNVEGKPLRMLVNERKDRGRHEVSWNGRDAVGKQVASGTYLFCLEAGPYREIGRMVLVK